MRVQRRLEALRQGQQGPTPSGNHPSDRARHAIEMISPGRHGSQGRPLSFGGDPMLVPPMDLRVPISEVNQRGLAAGQRVSVISPSQPACARPCHQWTASEGYDRSRLEGCGLMMRSSNRCCGLRQSCLFGRGWRRESRSHYLRATSSRPATSDMPYLGD